MLSKYVARKYCIFCSNPLQGDEEYTENDEAASRPPKQKDTSEPSIAANTASERLFEELLNKYYTPLEIWYTRTIIDKVTSSSQTHRDFYLSNQCRHIECRPPICCKPQSQRLHRTMYSTFLRPSLQDCLPLDPASEWIRHSHC